MVGHFDPDRHSLPSKPNNALPVASNCMEATYGAKSDPSEIHLKLDLLHHQKKIIEKLTVQLDATRLEYDRLEAEIKRYQASIAPIQKCPEEVLSMIFDSFSNRNPKFVTRLLPVCKCWYSMAMSHPHFWNHITINVENKWNQEREALRNNEQIKACLQRSASVPLHIALFFGEVDRTSTNLLKHVTDLLLNSISASQRQSFRTHLGSFNFEAFADAEISAACSPMHLLESVSLLVGERGQEMMRWETVYIQFPKNQLDTTEALWRLLCGPTPNLTKFVASNMDAVISSSKENIKGLPDLSSLEDLALGGMITNLDLFALKFSSVKRLTLCADLRLHHGSLQLSRFTLLEELRVACYGNLPGTSPTGPTGQICLPLLQKLRLSVNQRTMIRWDIPVLKELEILGKRTGDVFPELPDVRTLHFRWIGDLAEVNVTTRHSLEMVLSKYNTMQKITLPSLLKGTWGELVQDLSQVEGRTLPVVIFSSY